MAHHDCEEPPGYTSEDPFASPEEFPLFPAPANPLRPIPFPSDWWRCLRRRGISGRYEGGTRTFLDLRVDIDPRFGNSPVMNRLSGDFYNGFIISLPGRPFRTLKTYRESWIVDAPRVKWSACSVEIRGDVRFWQGSHPATTVLIVISWTFSNPPTANVAFTEGGTTRNFVCTYKSDCFRNVNLEVDVCSSVNAEPILPTYDTHAHNNRPADLPQRTLTIEQSYREAGICMTIRPDRTVIDDSAPAFSSWTPAELHDAMELHFSQMGGTWPKWELWGLLAGTFENPNVGGIMFDAAANFGGAGEPPERQGFTVFRNHSWFTDLVPGTPANQAQAYAMRHFLYTWVHEAGHAFNFLHSWNKGRPDSLSWMNYDWKYDQRNGADTFWANFRFRFDDEELIHIRHGDRASVIMGGDPWASGGHLETPPGAMAQIEGQAPVEFLLRSKGFFDFMEPVNLEFRLRNLLDDLPLDLDTRLNPDYGGVIVYIRRPDGRLMEFAPILCKLGLPAVRTLSPTTAIQGEDRYSEEVFLSYGAYGFYFDEPGEYLVRALYQGMGDILIPSNVLRLRIGTPQTKEEDRLSQDFFTYEVGMSLYLGGSRSPFLAKGMDFLEGMVDRYKNTLLGARVASQLLESFARPFFQIKDNSLTQTFAGDPEKALTLTEKAMDVYRKEKARALNLAYHQLAATRAQYLSGLGLKAEAKKELTTMRKDLTARGVNAPVLEEIKLFEESL